MSRVKTNHLILGTILACAALAIAGAAFGLRSYHAFTGQQLVAVVRIQPAPRDSGHPFLLELQTIDAQGVQAPPVSFLMHGDQWMIGGDILKWHPWLNLAGLRTHHKLTRLNSRYLKAADQQTKPQSVYELGGGTDPFWLWLYEQGRRFPVVEAVYGNAAYTFARPGTRWGVYVSISGYLIKPHQTFVGVVSKVVNCWAGGALMKWVMLVAGGSFGTVSRYLLSGLAHRFFGHGFPYGTLVVNTLGCLLIGFLATLIDRRWMLTPEQKLFCLIGFLGAFTTFSTLIYESWQMLEQNQWGMAGTHLIGSMVLGLLAIWAGSVIAAIL